jgi:hypothetical protein
MTHDFETYIEIDGNEIDVVVEYKLHTPIRGKRVDGYQIEPDEDGYIEIVSVRDLETNDEIEIDDFTADDIVEEISDYLNETGQDCE